MARPAKDGLLPAERKEIMGESEPDEGMTWDRFESVIRDTVYDAENWIEDDISPERERAHRYYTGDCDLKPQKNRSKFVMRIVRDTVEQMVPKLMEILAAGEDIVTFRAPSTDKAKQSQAADQTAAFNYIFWDKNPGWGNMEDFLRDALKAKTGVFKAYNREDTTVHEGEETLTEDEFAVVVDDDDVEVLERRTFTLPVVKQGILGSYVDQEKKIDATFKVIEKTPRTAIETIAPEELLVNRAATSLEPNYFSLVGQKSIKMVSEVVELVSEAMKDRLREEYEREPTDEEVLNEIVQHAGSGVEGATGDFQDAERRSRRKISSDPYEEQTFTDVTVRPIAYYELYVRIDKDEDGIAELRRVIGIGEGPAKVVEEQTVTDHPYFLGSAISIEHSVIGWSVADNVMDLQDVETQLTRGILDNAHNHNNPRRKAVKNQYDRQALIDNKFGGVVEVDHPNAISYEHIPFVGDKMLLVREAFDETRAERTGISKEAMGLDAKNLQASSEVGVLAVLGAGLTQPEMIAGNIAHRALVPLAKRVIKLLKERGEPINVKINSDGVYKEMSPADWDDTFDCDVVVGPGKGNRREKLAALNQIAARQERILLEVGPGNPIVTPEQYTQTLHDIAQLSGITRSTAHFNSPEEVRQGMEAKAQEPPQPDPEVEKERMKAQTDIQKTEIQAQTDIQQAQIKAMVDSQIAEENRELQERLRILEMAMEKDLAEKAIEAKQAADSSTTNLRRS